MEILMAWFSFSFLERTSDEHGMPGDAVKNHVVYSWFANPVI
jgi:hypothetical protein